MAKRSVDLQAEFRAPPARPKPSVVGDGGTVGITLHAAPEVREQLKDVAHECRTTVQDVLCQALNDLFAKYHRPEIARVIPRKPKRAGAGGRRL